MRGPDSNTGGRICRKVNHESGQQRQQNQATRDTAEAKKPDLPVTQAKNLLEHGAPPAGRDQRQQPFDHQHQSQCLPKAAAVHRALFSAGRWSRVAGSTRTTRATHGLEEL